MFKQDLKVVTFTKKMAHFILDLCTFRFCDYITLITKFPFTVFPFLLQPCSPKL